MNIVKKTLLFIIILLFAKTVVACPFPMDVDSPEDILFDVVSWQLVLEDVEDNIATLIFRNPQDIGINFAIVKIIVSLQFVMCYFLVEKDTIKLFENNRSTNIFVKTAMTDEQEAEVWSFLQEEIGICRL